MRRAASARARGSSVRSGGAGRPTWPITFWKMSRISARLRWMAGTRMGGQVAGQLHDQLGQVGLPHVDAVGGQGLVGSISWVAMDLTLTTSVAWWALATSATMALASAASWPNGPRRRPG